MENADLRLLMTVGGMLVSVVSAFVIVKTKLSGVIEQLADMEKRLRKLDSTIDKQHTAIETQVQRTHVLSGMLEPSKREKLHRSLERNTVEIEHLRRDVDAHRREYLSAHNGKHPAVPSEKAKSDD